MRPVCQAAKCRNPADNKGSGRWHRFCSLHRQSPWLLFRGERCERCGFEPEHQCQLDVDHIDGDKTNNNPANYQTLCANCHRLKSWQSGDYWTETSLPIQFEHPQLF